MKVAIAREGPDVIQKTKTMSIQNVTANVGPSPLVIETGKLAKLADGAVTVQMGETIVMVSEERNRLR